METGPEMRFPGSAIGSGRQGASRPGGGGPGVLLILAAVLLATLSLGASPPRAGGSCAPAGSFRLEGRDWVACGSAYVLSVGPGGAATLEDHAGHAYTSFPLAAVVRGRQLRDPGVALGLSGGVLTERMTLRGREVETVRLQAYPRGIVIGFSIRPYTDEAHWIDFFSDGRRGLDLSGESQGWTPQSGPDLSPQRQYMARPFVSTTSMAVNGTKEYAFSPPPLDLALEQPAGWMGIGLVRLPDADFMGIAAPGATPDARTRSRIRTGAVAVDYPLQILSRIRNRGHGGTSGGGMIRFPSFATPSGPAPTSRPAPTAPSCAASGWRPGSRRRRTPPGGGSRWSTPGVRRSSWASAPPPTTPIPSIRAGC